MRMPVSIVRGSYGPMARLAMSGIAVVFVVRLIPSVRHRIIIPIHLLALSSIPTIGPRERSFVSGLKSSYVPLPCLLVEPITERLAYTGPSHVRTPQRAHCPL